MAKRKILVQWIGHSDLRALAAAISPIRLKQILDRIGGQPPQGDDQGPTKTLLTAQAFDEVRLLSNYDASWKRWFQSWVGVPTKIQKVELPRPTDYSAIFEISDRELAEIKQRENWADTELCLHLSPGTPAMAAPSFEKPFPNGASTGSSCGRGAPRNGWTSTLRGIPQDRLPSGCFAISSRVE